MAEETGNHQKPQKRRRPSAKETRARMSRAVSAESPISRAEEEVEETREGVVEASPEPQDAASVEVEEDREVASDTGEAPRVERTVPRRRRDDGGRPVRLSVDVSKDEHRALRVLAAQSDTTGMAVMRALLQEALEDRELAERVQDKLESVGER